MDDMNRVTLELDAGITCLFVAFVQRGSCETLIGMKSIDTNDIYRGEPITIRASKEDCKHDATGKGAERA